MVRYVRARIEAIDGARGEGWLADRERFEREWNDDFSHRAGESAVFAKSNESLNLVGAGVDYIRAKILDEVFGSAPWFQVEPRGAAGVDLTLSEQIGQHLRWKLGPDQISFERVATDLVTQACKLGECVAKVAYRHEEEWSERIAVICWDERRDAPMLTEEGDPIFQTPGAELPPGCVWKEQIVSERKPVYSGAQAMPLHFKEFYCPLNAPTVQEADFVAHMTSMRLSELCAHLGVTPTEMDASAPEGDSAAEARQPGDYLARALRQIRREGALPKSSSGQPLPGEGTEAAVVGADPEFRLLEAYFRFDARGDGRPCRVFMMVAYDFDVPIFWDYIANVTPGGRYPFEAVVVNQEPHRWYGRSWFKKYEKFQRLIDQLLNQIIYRNELAANPIQFRRREAVVQWQDDQPLEIAPDKVFDLNDGYTAEDALQSVSIPELDEQTKFLLEMAVTNWRTRAGVSMASQGNFGTLPAERTATGISQIMSSGATLQRPQIQEVKAGLEGVLRQLVEYQYFYQEQDEIFSYREGDVRVLGTLIAAQVRDLEFAVELTLRRASQTRALDAAKLAVDFFAKFLEVPDAFKSVAAPLFTTVYKSLDIDHADAYFQQVVKIAQRAEANPTEGSQP